MEDGRRITLRMGKLRRRESWEFWHSMNFHKATVYPHRLIIRDIDIKTNPRKTILHLTDFLETKPVKDTNLVCKDYLDSRKPIRQRRTPPKFTDQLYSMLVYYGFISDKEYMRYRARGMRGKTAMAREYVKEQIK
jgi:hypothetical protein